jgi:hypothetical protein
MKPVLCGGQWYVDILPVLPFSNEKPFWLADRKRVQRAWNKVIRKHYPFRTQQEAEDVIYAFMLTLNNGGLRPKPR